LQPNMSRRGTGSLLIRLSSLASRRSQDVSEMRANCASTSRDSRERHVSRDSSTSPAFLVNLASPAWRTKYASRNTVFRKKPGSLLNLTPASPIRGPASKKGPQCPTQLPACRTRMKRYKVGPRYWTESTSIPRSVGGKATIPGLPPEGGLYYLVTAASSRFELKLLRRRY